MSKKSSTAVASPPPWLPDYVRQIDCLEDIVAKSRFLVGEINFSFPVEGKPYIFESNPGDCHLEVNVINATKRLDWLLYPLRLPFNATNYDLLCLWNGGVVPENFAQDKQVKNRRHKTRALLSRLKRQRFRESGGVEHYAFASFAGSPAGVIDHIKGSLAVRHISGVLFTAVRGVMVAHEQLLSHYGWGPEVAGVPSVPRRWQWPNAPHVPQRFVDALTQAADHLAGLLKADSIAASAAATPSIVRVDKNTDARDKWLYEQRCDGTPDKEILAELRRRCEEEGWRKISTISGIRDRAAVYAERKGLAAPPRRRVQ